LKGNSLRPSSFWRLVLLLNYDFIALGAELLVAATALAPGTANTAKGEVRSLLFLRC